MGPRENLMSASFTVFVCSTFDDLVEEREAVLDAIRRVQQRHNAMEFFGAQPEQPIKVCLDQVGKSDLLVVIVGLKYGSLPSGVEISYSQAEYEESVRLGKPCLVYLRDEDVPILPKFVEQDPDKLRLLKTWKGALNASHTVAKFESWPKLAVQVAADIGHFLLVIETSRAKGVPGAPLREVLKRLGETEVAEAEIPDRLAKAADELIRLRADLAKLTNERPEFAVIRACASALIDKGDFDGARAALNEGRERARALREEASRTEAGFLADEARVDRLQLNYDAACSKFAEAALLDPDNFWLWIELGDLWVTRGSLAEAAKAFSAARDAAAQSGNDRDLSVSYERIGNVQVEQGDFARATTSYRDNLTIQDRLAQSDPGNAQQQRDLYASHTFVGNVREAQGDLAGALKSYRDGFAIIDCLAKSDPGNARWQRELSVSYINIGERDLAGALTSYRDGFAIIDRLAKSDPSNLHWQRDLSVSYEKIGDVQMAQDDLAGALKSYEADLAIAAYLAKSDYGNAGWQRDLSESYNKIGDVQRAQGDLVHALISYRDGLAIIERLAQSDASNAGWRRDLSVSHNKIGDLQREQGDLSGALISYRDSLAIRESLAQSDSGNAGWQRDLAVSYGRFGFCLGKLENVTEALEKLQRGRAIMVRLNALSPDNAGWKRDLDRFEARITGLSR
jgi:tetratricopeptide (TPR) repeat protein